MARSTSLLWAAAMLALLALLPTLCLGATAAVLPTGRAPELEHHRHFQALLQTQTSCPRVGGPGAFGETRLCWTRCACSLAACKLPPMTGWAWLMG